MNISDQEYEAVQQAVTKNLPEEKLTALEVTKIAEWTYLVTATIAYPQSIECPHFHVSKGENSNALRVKQISREEFEWHSLAYNIFLVVKEYAMHNQAIGKVPQAITIRETKKFGTERRFSVLSNDSLRADVFCLNVYTVNYDTATGTFTVNIELSRLLR